MLIASFARFACIPLRSLREILHAKLAKISAEKAKYTSQIIHYSMNAIFQNFRVKIDQ
jgi:hypothetical protein